MSIFDVRTDVSESVRKKIKFYSRVAIFCFLILGMRLWYLQILKVEELQTLSENNRIRKIPLPPYRGKIFDRNGEALVGIRPSFNLYLIPEDARNVSETLKFLSKKIAIDSRKVFASIKSIQSFDSALIKADISREQVAFVEENSRMLPGVHLLVEPLRNYVHDHLSAHALGYLGEISKATLQAKPRSGYSQGDLVGKSGLEKIFESYLRGEKGYKEIEVDVAGRELRVLRELPPKSGGDLTLALDLRIQKTLENLMRAEGDDPFAGAAVVMNPQTGEIIAMTGQPSFNPNLFAAGISRNNWRKLQTDAFHPLQNRAIDGQYPPASTYKIVTAYAALEEKLIVPETTINCPGYFKLGRGTYRCWKKAGHGRVNLHDALVQSCDVFFYNVGNRLGVDAIARYAAMFGLGKKTGVKLLGEKRGLIPTSQWKLRTKRQPWLKGETISASIGQGFNTVTPIQQATMISMVANGGRRIQPVLVKRADTFKAQGDVKALPQAETPAGLNKDSLELIRRALLGVVNDKHGTGWRARMKNIKISGKTGTAQVVRMKTDDEQGKDDEIPYKFRDHAWFVAFAPYERPEIAVSVIVEHGGHGGAVAAPIAKKVIQTYFKLYPRDDSAVEVDKGATG